MEAYGTETDEGQLLAEIEEIIRSAPQSGAFTMAIATDAWAWAGRAAAAINNWDYTGHGLICQQGLQQLRGGPMMRVSEGYKTIIALLFQAQADLRFRTIGPLSAAIGQGRTFEYFDELRKVIALGKQEVWFVDPYLDADFVSRYLPHVSSGAIIRLLGRKYMAQLVSAASAFASQTNSKIEVRSSDRHHDRFVFVDGAACYQSGASFKDGARNAITTLTQITDAFTELKSKYEQLWQAATIEYSS